MIGSPIEKKEHFKKLMKFVNESPLDIVYLSILHYMEGSELWDDAVNQGKIKRDQTMVSANENLSNYSYDEWLKMKNELLRSFYFKPSWVLRIVYKLIRLGLILPFIKYLWVVRSSFFEKIKSPYMKERKESIIKVEN